jgi:hypothetical protein
MTVQPPLSVLFRRYLSQKERCPRTSANKHHHPCVHHHPGRHGIVNMEFDASLKFASGLSPQSKQSYSSHCSPLFELCFQTTSNLLIAGQSPFILNFTIQKALALAWPVKVARVIAPSDTRWSIASQRWKSS